MRATNAAWGLRGMHPAAPPPSRSHGSRASSSRRETNLSKTDLLSNFVFQTRKNFSLPRKNRAVSSTQELIEFLSSSSKGQARGLRLAQERNEGEKTEESSSFNAFRGHHVTALFVVPTAAAAVLPRFPYIVVVITITIHTISTCHPPPDRRTAYFAASTTHRNPIVPARS